MKRNKTDYGINTGDNIKHIEDYVGNNLTIFPERLTSESMSSDTMDALYNAEKLVQEARRTIAEAQRKVIHSKIISEDVQITSLTEEEREIKYLVAVKFDEANGIKVRTKLENTFSRGNSNAVFETKPTTPSECKKCFLKKPSSPRRPIPKQNHSLRNIEVQRGPEIDIRNDLSLAKLVNLEIYPPIPSTTINTGTFQLRHEVCKRGWINEPTSFIDTGVQTSLRDSSQITNFHGNALSRSRGSDLDKNNIDQSKVPAGGIKNDSKTGEIDSKGPEVITHLMSMKRHKKLGQMDFMDFLYGIKSLEEKSTSEQERKSSIKSLNSSTISLTTPDTVNVDNLLIKIDKKLKLITQTTDNLHNELCSNKWNRLTRDNKNKHSEINENLMRCKSSDYYQVEVLLEPRSTVSSLSSAVSSETLHPAKFSTPLNNLKIDETESNVKLPMDNQSTRTIVISTSAPVISELKNIESNVIDGIVPMTRNKLLYEKNDVVHKIDKILHLSSNYGKEESAVNSKTDVTASLFPTYLSDKSDAPTSHRSELQSLSLNQGSKNIEIDSIHSDIKITSVECIKDKIMRQLSEEFPIGLSCNETEKVDENNTEKYSENCLIISSEKNQENPAHGSSDLDATSHDISKLSSVILEASGDDEKKSSQNLSESNGEKESLGRIKWEEQQPQIASGTEKEPEEKSTLKSISNKQSIPSASSSSTSLSSNRMTQKNLNADYSEGELFLPSSCTYSLGEVIMSSGPGIINKICVNLSSRTASQIHAPDHSPGELLDTDIDSNSSFASRGQLA